MRSVHLSPYDRVGVVNAVSKDFSQRISPPITPRFQSPPSAPHNSV